MKPGIGGSVDIRVSGDSWEYLILDSFSLVALFWNRNSRLINVVLELLVTEKEG